MKYASRTLTIGQLAEEADVSVETIRYYQRIELLETPPKSMRGYRQYPVEMINVIGFIHMAKQLDFTLNEIKTLLTLRRGNNTYCHGIRLLAERKVNELNEKSRNLERAKAYLNEALEKCTGNDLAGDCPIIEKLNKGPLLSRK